MIKKLLCIVGKHEFKREPLISFGNLSVHECKHCSKVLNIHSGMDSSFVSSYDSSMVSEIHNMKDLFAVKR